MDQLAPHTLETHRVLETRLANAEAAHNQPNPRDAYPAIDTFLATAARHNAAVNSVLVPAVRSHLDDGPKQARNYVQQSRRFELALNQVKAKLYGSAYAQRRTWDSIWSDARREFEHLWKLEKGMVQDLVSHSRDDDPDWSEKLYRTERNAPTRPHPWIPHQGLRGHLARTVAARVDSFWDVAEGRMYPEPVHLHDRTSDGPMTQYLLGDPHLPDEED